MESLPNIYFLNNINCSIYTTAFSAHVMYRTLYIYLLKLKNYTVKRRWFSLRLGKLIVHAFILLAWAGRWRISFGASVAKFKDSESTVTFAHVDTQQFRTTRTYAVYTALICAEVITCVSVSTPGFCVPSTLWAVRFILSVYDVNGS